MHLHTTALAGALAAIGVAVLLVAGPGAHAHAVPAQPETASAARLLEPGSGGEPVDEHAHADHGHGAYAQQADSHAARGHEEYAHGGESHADHDRGYAGARHGDWLHRLQDWVIALFGGVHPHGDAYGHDHAEPLAVTLYGGETELFAELPPLVAGERAELLVHLTRLPDFKPVTEGEVSVSLSGGGAPEETFAAPAPARPGLFRVTATPAVSGERRLRLVLDAPGLRETHDLGLVPVHPDLEAAEAAQAPGEPADEGVVLLKEQQWQADFATALAGERLLRESVPATGLLRPSADGEAHMTSPIDGHLAPAFGGFPYTGLRVEAGQVIAYLVPQLGGEADVAGLELAVTRATSLRNLARQERERLDALWNDRSVPYRDVLEARSAEEVAEAELTAARRRLAQVQRTEEGEAAGVPIRAPIGALVARVDVAPGGFVEEGDRLFHLVDPERLWLEARVAEADLGRIQSPAGAWFHVQGFDETFEVAPGGGARLVAFGAMVDPESRTVPVIFEFPRPDPRLRVGQAVTARVFTGEEETALAVPAGALINDAGADVLYVQTGGERFERRLVRTGLRDGEYVAIEAGLAPGERVVSRGAYLVHLAAGAPAEVGHGHAH
jgi:RND family efflux transporter MFP subunit